MLLSSGKEILMESPKIGGVVAHQDEALPGCVAQLGLVVQPRRSLFSRNPNCKASASEGDGQPVVDALVQVRGRRRHLAGDFTRPFVLLDQPVDLLAVILVVLQCGANTGNVHAWIGLMDAP